MRGFKKMNNCNFPGAWLILKLQGDEIPDIDEAIVVMKPPPPLSFIMLTL
jgi:hypothetical protein